MITNPTLIVMAAGMGSRYGGLKQIDPVTDQGEIILDFSLYDAMLAGFTDVVFIIKKENEEDFRALIDERAGKHVNVHYAFQDVRDVPDWFTIPEGREKPWGTGHAVLAARNLVAGPFAVINADDYYGSSAFQSMYDFLENSRDNEKYQYAMVGYMLERTLSESGHVARGVCRVSEESKLLDITERTKIMRLDEATAGVPAGAIGFTEDEGQTWTELPGDTMVSMNFWGFTPSFMKELEAGFPGFLRTLSNYDLHKGEYFLPGVVNRLLEEGKAEVKVLRSEDQWYGVTYKDDKPGVTAALQSMKDKGIYPEKLWV